MVKTIKNLCNMYYVSYQFSLRVSPEVSGLELEPRLEVSRHKGFGLGFGLM